MNDTAPSDVQMESRLMRLPLPGVLNISLSLITGASALALLWIASHTNSWVVRLVSAFVFSYVNNTLFSLLHEAVHGVFHSNRAINNAYGRVLAAFFPTGFRFQQLCHLGHHRRNRTEPELFDYYRPGDNMFMKYFQWYGILTGLYWTLSPLGCLVYLFCPWIMRISVIRDKE